MSPAASVSQGNGPTGAVFLSYAREDTDAARRVADALRAFGLEVWFDQNELVGGDAWDAKIKRQIRECALFVPIISAQTQARAEGYFRREWKLAVERTHDMAETMPFLLPVVIDGTLEAGALVPEVFLRTHWMRLPRGLPTPQFVAQVEKLLGMDPATVARPATTAPSRIEGVSPGRRTRGLLLTVIAAALIAGVAGWWWTNRAGHAGADIGEKSIAVLPFANMSDDKSNEFFAEGVHEDLLTNLSMLSDLKVISRTSVMGYRQTTKLVQQIGAELGVAYLLEGSVRRVGNKVRVTAQLIEAGKDRHVWSKNYDRELTDIFAIQGELAKAIASELHAVLSPQEAARLERSPTKNTAAYDLYLRAREIANAGNLNGDTLTHAVALLESAVELDPKFAAAWGALAEDYIGLSRRTVDAGQLQQKAERAIGTMESLAPDDPNTCVTLSTYYLSRQNFAQAEQYLQHAAAALPNNGFVVLLQADADKRDGRADEALQRYRRAYELDPQHPAIVRNYGEWLVALRRYDEAARIERNNLRADGRGLAMLAFWSMGSEREMEAWLAAHSAANTEFLLDWKFLSGSAADYVKLQDAARTSQPGGRLKFSEESTYADALMALGQTARARAVAASVVAGIRAAGVRGGPEFASALALAGDRAGALASLAAWQEEDRKAGRHRDYLGSAWSPPFILLAAGEKDKALAEFARLLKIPSGLNVNFLRHCWSLKSLQDDSAFEALLNDPANNAPLL